MRRLTTLTALLALALAGVASAGYRDVIRDCADDSALSKQYSQAELREALQKLPSDVDEYTNCRDVIRAAQVRGVRGVTGGKTPGGSTGATGSNAAADEDLQGPSALGGFGEAGPDPISTASKEEKEQLKRDRKDSTPVPLGPTTVTPGAVGRRTATVANDLPAPLLAALVVLGGGLLCGVVLTVRRRVNGPRSS